jgi:hypothetical protein
MYPSPAATATALVKVKWKEESDHDDDGDESDYHATMTIATVKTVASPFTASTGFQREKCTISAIIAHCQPRRCAPPSLIDNRMP